MGIVAAAFILLWIGETSAVSNESESDVEEMILSTRSDDTEIELDTSCLKHTGNVLITFGPTEITADKAMFYLKGNPVGGQAEPISAEVLEKVIISGNVTIVSEFGVASAREVVYDADAQTLVLMGEPATMTYKGWDHEGPKIRLTSFSF